MSFFHNSGIGIAGIACAVPDNYVTVESFKKVFGETIPEIFTAGTGIRGLYKALPEQTASDLARRRTFFPIPVLTGMRSV